MKKILCLTLLAGALLSSCGYDDTMDVTVFIPDKEDPMLPAYTEWGYNSFGAKYERDYFLVSNRSTPCRVLYRNNQLEFSLHGKARYEDKNMALVFIFPSAPIANYTDLVNLHGTSLDLTGSSCMVKMIQDDVDTTLNVLSGTLHFKRAQRLSIDDEMRYTILSGTFDLRFIQNDFSESISNGRFDMAVNYVDIYSN